MKSPVFSVIMPTYNRAHLLPLAIQSVLGQSFDDLELIISNGGSSDNTREVVAGFTDPRIRYSESPERLSIGDNYQTGLDKARGTYITFLGDDDAFVPSMFEHVLKVIRARDAKIVAFRVSSYFHDDDIELNLQTPISANTLAIPYWTGAVTSFDSARAVEILFGRYGLNTAADDAKFITPFLANAVYHRSIFDTLKETSKELFAWTPADMYLAAAVFFVVDSYYCLDLPLHVWSQWAGNSTASPHRQLNDLRAHYENLMAGKEPVNTPLKFPLPHNLVVNALLQAKADFAGIPKAHIDIDWAGYYVMSKDILLYLAGAGVDVRKESAEFSAVLSRESDALQKRVRAQISSPKFIAKQLVRTKLAFLKRPLKFVLRSEQRQDLISGNTNGFDNFLLAARFVDSKIPCPSPMRASRSKGVEEL